MAHDHRRVASVHSLDDVALLKHPEAIADGNASFYVAITRAGKPWAQYGVVGVYPIDLPTRCRGKVSWSGPYVIFELIEDAILFVLSKS